MTPAEAQQALAALQQLGAAAQNSKASIQSVGQSMAKLRAEMQRGAGSASAQAASLNRLMADFDSLDPIIKKHASAQAIAAEQANIAKDLFKRTAGDLAGALTKSGVTEAIDYFRNQFFTAVKNLQDNVSGTSAVFNQQNVAIESQIKILDRLASGAGVAAESLAMIPSPWARAGAVAAAGVAAFATLAKGASELQKQGLGVLQTEVTKSALSFDAMSKSGALFEGGISDMRNGAAELQLDLNEFAKVVARNKETLADFGGSVVGGTIRLRNVGTEFQKFRTELTNLGYSYEEQSQGIIDYIQLQKQAGQDLRSIPSAQLAKDSADYMKNLRAISAFTGEDVKNAQKRARDASTQLAVNAKLQSMGAGAMERFQSGIQNMEPFMQKALQQATAFDGTVVDKELAQLFAMSPARQRLFEQTYQDTLDTTLSAADITKRYQERVKELGPALAEDGKNLGNSLGAVTLATNNLAGLTGLVEQSMQTGLKAQNSLINLTDDFNGKLGSTTDQVKKLGDGADSLRKTITELDTTQRQYMAGFIQTMTPIINRYMTKGSPFKEGDKAVPSMLEQLKEQNATTLALMQHLGFLAELHPTLKVIQTEIGKKAREFDTSVTEQALIGAAQLLKGAAVDLGKAAAKLAGVPGFASGTAGSGNILRDFGDGTLARLHGKEAVLTEDQLLKITGANKDLLGSIKGNEASQQLADALDNLRPTPDLRIDDSNQKLSDAVANLKQILPDLKKSVDDSFRSPADMIKNLDTQYVKQEQIPKFEPEKILSDFVNNPNLITSGLTELTKQITNDNQAAQSLMREYLSKLDVLISTVEENADYSKRIADNI